MTEKIKKNGRKGFKILWKKDLNYELPRDYQGADFIHKRPPEQKYVFAYMKVPVIRVIIFLS